MTDVSKVPTPADRKPKKIFLNYDDKETYPGTALWIRDDLEKKGYGVWFDRDQMIKGRDWPLYIEEGLRDCDRFVLLMTSYSVRRRNSHDPKSKDGYCLNEMAKVFEKNILIIPVLLEDLENGLQISICRIQYLDTRTTSRSLNMKDDICNILNGLSMLSGIRILTLKGGSAKVDIHLGRIGSSQS
jgi:hypothetical protein